MYRISALTIGDNAGNKEYLYLSTNTLPQNLMGIAFYVFNGGVTADYIASTTTSDLASNISSQNSDAKILVDYTSNASVSEGVFDAIKGTDRTLTLESQGIQWVFDGNDISKPSKDIDLGLAVNYLSSLPQSADKTAISETVGTKNTVVLTFPENGILPGKAKIRVKADYAMKEFLGQSGIYVYYMDNVTNKNR